MWHFNLALVTPLLWLQFLQVLALKGDGMCGRLICVNATVHHDTVTYQMTARKERMGWLAVGFGRRMAGSDMVVMWRNEDDSYTISQRYAEGHIEPSVVEEPPRVAFLPEVQGKVWDSKLKPENTLSFSIPLDKSQWHTDPTTNETYEQLIWAYGMTRPKDSDPYSSIYGHYSAGSLKLQLEKELTSGSPETDVAGTRPVSEEKLPYTTHELLVLGHGFFMSIGMLVLLPFGALVARWTRTFSSKWFKAHKILNYMIALPVIIVGWLLGPLAVFDAQASHFMDTHQICGIVILVLYLLQLYLGRYIHARKDVPKRSTHPPSNILHACFGLLLIGVAFFQVRSGMDEWSKVTGRAGSHWCHVLWNVWIIAAPVIYLLGLSLLKRQFHQESTGVNPSSTPKHYIPLSPDERNGMLFSAETEFEPAPEYEDVHSSSGLAKERESEVPLLHGRK